MESMIRQSSGGDVVADTKKLRVQFDFSPDALERLDDLREASGAATRAETVRDALSLYEWFIKEVKAEDTVQVYDPEGKLLTSFKAKLLRKR